MLENEMFWNITSYYLIFTAVDLGLCFLVYKAWRDHIRTWKIQESRWQIALLLLAGLLVIIAAIILLFLFYVLYAAWRTALNPNTPAPLFEIIWFIGIFAVAVPAAFSGLLHTFIRKEYDELIP